jgi:plasmid stabilization system protein ParE
MKVHLTPEAKADLEDIGDRITKRKPARAVTYLQELRERATRIGEFPTPVLRDRNGAGRSNRRSRQVPDRLRVRDETVQVLRVVHGARDLGALLGAEPFPE